MKHDLHKLGLWLEKVCQDGIALEHKILEWKQADSQKPVAVQQAKAS